MLELRGISKTFGSTQALLNVNLSIPTGKRFSLIGGSGAGKTTLLRVLAGLEQPDAGAIFYEGADISRTAPHLRGIALVSQDYSIYPHLTIEKNLLAAIEPLGLKTAERSERLESALRWFELMPFRGRRPAQLSGGQLQRAALAKALIRRPKVLLLDEPLSQLDLLLKEQGRGLIVSLTEQFETTLVMVTHDPIDALRMSDILAVMESGAIVQMDSPQKVYHFPNNRTVADMLSPFGINRVELRSGLSLTVSSDFSEAASRPSTLSATTGRVASGPHIFFRPEAGRLLKPSENSKSAGDILLPGKIERLQFLGFATLAFISLQNDAQENDAQGQSIRVLVRDRDFEWEVGESAEVSVNIKDLLGLESPRKVN